MSELTFTGTTFAQAFFREHDNNRDSGVTWGGAKIHMRYHVLATDYDSTIARDGFVNDRVIAALKRLLDSGRRLVLVSGRELDELLAIFPEMDLFEWVVAENGALLYQPSTKTEKQLAEPPAEAFVHFLHDRGVVPISKGRVIIATREPNEVLVIKAIRDMGLELQVIFNKGAVMVLPTGVTKATGLSAALANMALSRHNVVGVGDAENDHHFLSICECSAAVANALPAVKERVDVVLSAFYGDGVVELIDRMIATDLRDIEDRLTRHHILLGSVDGKHEYRIPPYGTNMLITGPVGAGKSAFAAMLLDRFAETGYQFCVIDPVGDHTAAKHSVALGTSGLCPVLEDVERLFASPEQNGVVNISGLPAADRPGYFELLWARLEQLRIRTGRPHWIVVDEAHYVLPADLPPKSSRRFHRMVFITSHTDNLAPDALASINEVITLGHAVPPPSIVSVQREDKVAAATVAAAAANEATAWRREANFTPVRIQFTLSSEKHP